LNSEGKQRWNILKNQQHLNSKELEDLGHYWVIQQNIDDNCSVSPAVTCQGYSYTWFVTCIKWTDTYYVPPKKEKKKWRMFQLFGNKVQVLLLILILIIIIIIMLMMG
jgi:hypothetical protein